MASPTPRSNAPEGLSSNRTRRPAPLQPRTTSTTRAILPRRCTRWSGICYSPRRSERSTPVLLSRGRLLVEEMFRDVWVELLGERSKGAKGGGGKTTLEGKTKPTVAPGIVDVRNGAADEVSTQVSICGLPLPIVSLGTDWRDGRVPQTGCEAPFAEPEITRILMQK